MRKDEKDLIIKAFFRGFSSILNLTYTEKPVKYRGFEADVENMRSDWMAVGQDLRKGQERYAQRERAKEERVAG